MIKEFSFKNFLSFKNSTIFSMEADYENVSEFPEHLIEIGNEKILKVASLYGPNAAGKSNLLKSLIYFRNIILYGLDNKKVDDERIRMSPSIKKFEKFDFCNNKDSVIEFKMFFINEQYEIGYELQIENHKEGIMTIKYESMSYRNINDSEFIFLFERMKNKFELSDELSVLLLKSDFQISDQITFVSFINELYINRADKNIGLFKILKNFMDEVINLIYLRPMRSMRVTGMSYSAYENEKIKLKALEIINKLGITISDIVVEETSDRRKKVYVVRDIDGIKYSLDVDKESDGTLMLLYLLPGMLRIIENGGTLLIDEIDAHLHPKLTREIIQMFTSKYNNKAQLIFTSHDILNMTNELFRRDEIWFVVKNQDYASELMALTDFVNYKGEKVRKDAKYSKQYLEGKYGADPFIQKGVYWDVKNS